MFIFDLGTKYIFGFFLLIFVANYTTFVSFDALYTRILNDEERNVKQKRLYYYLFINALYVAVILLAFVEDMGPFCRID